MSEPLEITSTSATALFEAVQKYADAAVAENTHAAIKNALKQYEGFCARWHQVWPPAPEHLVLWATELAEGGRSVATIMQYCSLVGRVCVEQGRENPCDDPRVKRVLRGIRRSKPVRSPNAKSPLHVDDLRAVLRVCPEGGMGTRDRAMLCVGYYAALRRSELCALRTCDVQEVDRGLVVTVRRSKSDQEAKGIVKVAPRVPDALLDPATALAAWKKLYGPRKPEEPLWFSWPTGTLQRIPPTPDAWAEGIKRLFEKAELDPMAYGTHSMRSGWATMAARKKARVDSIQRHLGHASAAMALRYVRDEDQWADHVGALIL